MINFCLDFFCLPESLYITNFLTYNSTKLNYNYSFNGVYASYIDYKGNMIIFADKNVVAALKCIDNEAPTIVAVTFENPNISYHLLKDGFTSEVEIIEGDASLTQIEREAVMKIKKHMTMKQDVRFHSPKGEIKTERSYSAFSSLTSQAESTTLCTDGQKTKNLKLLVLNGKDTFTHPDCTAVMPSDMVIVDEKRNKEKGVEAFNEALMAEKNRNNKEMILNEINNRANKSIVRHKDIYKFKSYHNVNKHFAETDRTRELFVCTLKKLIK